jgi:homopolymeric O-antigen transport system permease protein
MVRTLWRARRLLWTLVVRDLRAEVVGSAGGAFWLIARPLSLFLVYYLFFSVILGARAHAAGGEDGSYAVFLLAGLLPWLAYVESLSQGAGSIVSHGDLLRKTRLPAVLLPAKQALGSAARYLPFLVPVFLVAAPLSSGAITAGGLLLLWVLLQLLTCIGLSALLAILTAAFRDVGQFLVTASNGLLFLAPILYSIDRVGPTTRRLLYLNPFTPFANGYQAIVLRHQPPPQMDILAVLAWLALIGGMAVLLDRRSREQITDWV